MGQTKTKVDTKKKLVVVENGNVLEEERRKYKPLLDIAAYSFYVEVPYEINIDHASKLESAAEAAVKKFETELRGELEALVAKIEKLQGDEKRGNSKAVSEATKLVKSHEKKLKDSPADYNIAIRKAIQKVIAAETKQKTQLRSVGRSVFRGLSLADGVFQEEDDSEVDLEDLGDDLANASKRFVKTADDDRAARRAAAEAGGKVLSAVETGKQKAKDKFDYRQFLSEQHSLLVDTEKEISSYVSFLIDCQKEAQKSDKLVVKIEKDKTLKSDREAMKAVKEFREIFKEVKDTLDDELRELSRFVSSLRALKDDNTLKQVKTGVDRLSKPLSLDKRLKDMEKLFAQLEKLAKKR